MTIDFSEKGKFIISMFDYVKETVQNLPEFLQSTRDVSPLPADHFFEVNDCARNLPEDDAKIFHHFVVAKLLYLSKRARPDMQTAVAFLCTRVKAPDVDDTKKLQHALQYLKQTVFLPLIITWDGTKDLYWRVDASFAIHRDFKGHTGASFTMGNGSLLNLSTKQKVNARNSTESEIIA